MRLVEEDDLIFNVVRTGNRTRRSDGLRRGEEGVCGYWLVGLFAVGCDGRRQSCLSVCPLGGGDGWMKVSVRLKFCVRVFCLSGWMGGERKGKNRKVGCTQMRVEQPRLLLFKFTRREGDRATIYTRSQSCHTSHLFITLVSRYTAFGQAKIDSFSHPWHIGGRLLRVVTI